MISLLNDGQWMLFGVILVALMISLSFHEFGHAVTALRFGDDTARRAGRLTVNPVAHIDPLGLLMVVFVGFGYAKPVPTNPRLFNSRYAELWVAAAGPLMNLLLAHQRQCLSIGVEVGLDLPCGCRTTAIFHLPCTDLNCNSNHGTS